MKSIFLFLLTAFVFSSTIAQQNVASSATGNNGSNVFRYTNPITRDSAISMRDHFIIKVGNKWYCT